MSISWITGIYNNSDTTFYMWADDSRHLGVVHDAATGKEVGRCDDGGVVPLRAGGHFTAEWCGIPWYHDERHARALSHSGTRDRREALLMWQSRVATKDGVVLLNGTKMTPIGGYEFSGEAEYRYALMIDNARDTRHGQFEIALDLRNTNDTAHQVVNLLGKVLGDAYDDLRTLRVEAGKAAIGKAAGKG